MKLAITTSNPDHILRILDTETSQEFLLKTDPRGIDYRADKTRPPHRPYGITWNKDHIFIANRTNLLIYNSNLELVDVRQKLLDQNTHQIAIRGDQLIATRATLNCIQYINLEDYSSQFWHPKFGYLSDRPNLGACYHINSVLAEADDVYVMAHNQGKRTSQIVVGDSVTDTGYHMCHNIYLKDGVIGFVATREKKVVIGEDIISNPFWEAYFLRGLAGDDKQLAVGCSDFNAKRKDRANGDGYVSIIKDKEVQKHCLLEESGNICDIRRIDGPDFCHHNPHPFPLLQH